MEAEVYRNSYFVRATIVNYSYEMKSIINLAVNMLKSYDMKKSNLCVVERCADIEEIFLLIMNHPEILCHYPKFREICITKANDCNDSLHAIHIEESKILSDFRYVCEMIKIRPDYLDNSSEQVEDSNKVSQVKNTHNYNLRSRTMHL